jgi:hypothetical protein
MKWATHNFWLFQRGERSNFTSRYNIVVYQKSIYWQNLPLRSAILATSGVTNICHSFAVWITGSSFANEKVIHYIATIPVEFSVFYPGNRKRYLMKTWVFKPSTLRSRRRTSWWWTPRWPRTRTGRRTTTTNFSVIWCGRARTWSLNINKKIKKKVNGPETQWSLVMKRDCNSNIRKLHTKKQLNHKGLEEIEYTR